MLHVAVGHARRVLKRFFDAAQDTVHVQQRVLLEKIRRNADSQYGRTFGFASIRSYADFKRQVPRTRYEDLEPYVEKVKSGQVDAMFGGRQRVHMFAKTSGTTDRPKYIPVTTPFLREYRRGWNAFGVKALMDHPDCFLRHIVQVASPMDEECTDGGFDAGAITGLMAAHQKRLVRRYYAVPPQTAYITDPIARYYTIMRFAAATDVAFMITANPATQLRLVRTADEHAQELIRDVRDGSLCSKMNVPSPVRAALEPLLRPDAVAAERLSRIADASGRLLPRDYWNLGFVANWTGGTMGLYLSEFPEFFGTVQVRDIGLLASEGRMSIPIDDHTPVGICDVACNFFEFIPRDEYETDDPTILRAHELEAGREYFILLTNSAGFYRYDIGDCVRVHGYHQKAPLIEFLHKGLHVSSLTGEKLTEQQVVMAMNRVARELSVSRPHFVLAPAWGDPPHYRLHLEPIRGVGEEIISRIGRRFEQCLQDINVEYASKCKSCRLGPVEVNLLPEKWLTDLDQQSAQQQRGVNEQFKHRYLCARLDEDRSFPIRSRGGAARSDLIAGKP